MRLGRLMQNCPSRTKPTKGRRCASQQTDRRLAERGQKRRIKAGSSFVRCPLYPQERTSFRSFPSPTLANAVMAASRVSAYPRAALARRT